MKLTFALLGLGGYALIIFAIFQLHVIAGFFALGVYFICLAKAAIEFLKEQEAKEKEEQ